MKSKTAKKTNGNGAKVAYSYRRFSSRNPQQRDGTSLKRQLEMAQEVCTRMEWRLVDLPPDAGVSAFKITDLDESQAANFHKGQLGKFLAKARAGEIKAGSVLVLERLDRFSRNYFDIVFPVWLELLQAGIEIYSCVSRTHYTLAEIRKNPMLAGMALMELANANQYSSGMSDRIGKAFSIRLAECVSGKQMNLGNWQPRWIDFDGKKGEAGTFTFNDYAKTVKRIVLDYINGKSMIAIAKTLIAENVPTAQGGKWGSGTIENILHNTALTGTIKVKGITLENYYPPLIDKEQYNALRSKLSDNKNKKGGNPTTDEIVNLFRNRVKCVCGGSIRAEHHYYRCRNHEIGQCKAKGGSLMIKMVEQDFFGFFLQEQPEALLGKHTPKHNQEIARLKTRIAEIEKGIADTAHLIGKFPVSQLEAKLGALVQEKEKATAEMETANLKLLTTNKAPSAFADIRAALLKWDETDGDLEAVKAFNRGVNEMIDQLADNVIRKRLLDLIPSLVERLEMDLRQSRYRIINASGEVSDWQDLAV